MGARDGAERTSAGLAQFINERHRLARRHRDNLVKWAPQYLATAEQHDAGRFEAELPSVEAAAGTLRRLSGSLEVRFPRSWPNSPSPVLRAE
jgi:hypothetical protein